MMLMKQNSEAENVMLNKEHSAIYVKVQGSNIEDNPKNILFNVLQ